MRSVLRRRSGGGADNADAVAELVLAQLPPDEAAAARLGAQVAIGYVHDELGVELLASVAGGPTRDLSGALLDLGGPPERALLVVRVAVSVAFPAWEWQLSSRPWPRT